MRDSRKTVSVVITVLNDREGCAAVLDSLRLQSRQPDEILVLDGGSTDGTQAEIRKAEASNPRIRMIVAPGVNIARGRNLAIDVARGEIIATTDAGSIAEPTWLQALVAPFEEDESVEFVAGCYQVESRSLLERVVGLATMRGQLDPVDPKRFNPSARSVAYTKSLWRRAGGLPDWLRYSEDTLFDHKIRRMQVNWRFARSAVVRWRPRGSIRALAKQFFNYGTGRGHTQIGKDDFLYNLRNVLILLAVIPLFLLTPWALMLPVLGFSYFYVWTFHDKARRIAEHTGRRLAYPCTLIVMWVVLFSNLLGYLVGTWQRWMDPARYKGLADAYLSLPSQSVETKEKIGSEPARTGLAV